MVVKMDTDEAFAPIRQQRESLLEILLVLAMLGGFAAFYFGWQMVMRLKSFAQNADEIARGDLSQRVDESGRDEIGVLGRAFNRMTENLQALYRTLEDRVEERTRELNVSNEQLQEEIIEREHIENGVAREPERVAAQSRFAQRSAAAGAIGELGVGSGEWRVALVRMKFTVSSSSTRCSSSRLTKIS